jgi:hypothetical protein
MLFYATKTMRMKMKMIGGILTVESEPGRGSVFVTLPVAVR